jgi:hypothetical protein
LEQLLAKLRLSRPAQQPVNPTVPGPRPVPSHQDRLPLLDDDIPDWRPRPMTSRR